MDIKQINTAKDICKLLKIDYDDKVAEDLDDIIAANETWPEFKEAFHKYYSEQGLGGDDKYEECIMLLSYLLEDVIVYRPGDEVELRGNSGLLYYGTILEKKNNLITVKIGNDIVDTDIDFINRRIRKAELK